MSQDGSERGTPRPEGAAAAGGAVQESKSQASSTATAAVSTSSVMESFFPFDPYKLESSASFIEPLYREWSEVAPEEDGSDSSEDETDDEDERMI